MKGKKSSGGSAKSKPKPGNKFQKNRMNLNGKKLPPKKGRTC